MASGLGTHSFWLSDIASSQPCTRGRLSTSLPPSRSSYRWGSQVRAASLLCSAHPASPAPLQGQASWALWCLVLCLCLPVTHCMGKQPKVFGELFELTDWIVYHCMVRLRVSPVFDTLSKTVLCFSCNIVLCTSKYVYIFKNQRNEDCLAKHERGCPHSRAQLGDRLVKYLPFSYGSPFGWCSTSQDVWKTLPRHIPSWYSA